tara:strand:+ start:260 stop:475 length:216 start_codon:yes stop_codon:yes gene_type:complete
MNNINQTLHLTTIAGETEPQKRRRAALAITHIISEDELLRAEVCALLNVDDDTLMWRTPQQGLQRELFTAL